AITNLDHQATQRRVSRDLDGDVVDARLPGDERLLHSVADERPCRRIDRLQDQRPSTRPAVQAHDAPPLSRAPDDPDGLANVLFVRRESDLMSRIRLDGKRPPAAEKCFVFWLWHARHLN